MDFVSDSPVLEEAHVKSWKVLPDPNKKNEVIEEIIDFLCERRPLSPSTLFRSRLCLDEALTNSITHGCPEGPDQPVSVDFHYSEETGIWGVRIADHGPGFVASELPSPDDPGADMLEHGRGIVILQRFTVSLVFAQGGREVVFRMRCEESES